MNFDFGAEPFALIGAISGLVFLIAGGWMRLLSPKTINPFVGYRTRRSMASQESWDFAQKYAGGVMTIGGIILLSVSALCFLGDLSFLVQFILTLSMMVATVLGMLFLTERKLKRSFG